MELVQQGKVTVNGKVVREPSMPIGSNDKVCFGGKAIGQKKFEYLLFYKPEGVTTTRKDFFAEKTVIDFLPSQYRHLNPVGRLDKNTEGLLLFTNDGNLAYRLTHPRFSIDKIYFVQLIGKITPSDRSKLEAGVFIEQIKTAPCQIRDVHISDEKTTLRIILHEGRKRQVRYMFGSLGYKVVYLKREKQGPISLGQLKPGQWRLLLPKEIESLKTL